MQQISTLTQLERAFAQGTFLLFLHSLLCEASLEIFREYEQWSSKRPGTETGWIDVNAAPSLARAASDRTRIPLAFPQAIFLRGGRPSWTATHGAITQGSLGAAFGWPLPAR